MLMKILVDFVSLTAKAVMQVRSSFENFKRVRITENMPFTCSSVCPKPSVRREVRKDEMNNELINYADVEETQEEEKE